MPKAIRASATTAAANSLMWPKTWPSTGPSSCSAAALPTCSRTPARQANQGVFQALIKPGDTILGMSLDAGGHLTHGAAPNQSGKWFNAVQYGVRKQDLTLDYDQVARSLATEHKPKLIIAGGSAIPAHHRLRPHARDCRSGRRLPAGRHGAFRRPRGRRASTPRPSRMPMSRPPPPTKPCAARAAA